VRVPALIAALPFLRDHPGADTTSVAELGDGAPKFIEGLVTELAGPGLRLEARLPAGSGDRVLVVFPLAAGGAATRRGARGCHRPREYCRPLQASVAVELVGRRAGSTRWKSHGGDCVLCGR
jgi:hypothetical protein